MAAFCDHRLRVFQTYWNRWLKENSLGLMLRRKEQGSKKCRGSAAQRRSLFFVPLALMRTRKMVRMIIPGKFFMQFIWYVCNLK